MIGAREAGYHGKRTSVNDIPHQSIFVGLAKVVRSEDGVESLTVDGTRIEQLQETLLSDPFLRPIPWPQPKRKDTGR